uniref:Uncharacterized protein n=1 Tax=Euplotes crassus TaxID=5936 RepID=A0A7S3KQR2_EUPCR|mmetsp:Transcript_3959/g.3725  ORF Transcript_3959/g.3725 Transcript_3959/m.3725 type:complete len:215 (+) Transcript_3959:288-932(+)
MIENKKKRIKPLLLMTKPDPVAKSKMFNFRSSSVERKEVLNKFKEISEIGFQTSRPKPFQTSIKKKAPTNYTISMSPTTADKRNSSFITKRLSLQKPPSNYLDSQRPKMTPRLFFRDLHKNKKIEELFYKFQEKDKKSKVCSYILFNGNMKPLTDHEHRYKDCIVNRPRDYKDNPVNYMGDNINTSIRSFLKNHRNDADKGIFDDLRPTEDYQK